MKNISYWLLIVAVALLLTWAFILAVKQDEYNNEQQILNHSEITKGE